jgi:hypothetical protein
MHVKGCESLYISGSGRYPPKRLGWAFGPLFDREYEYIGFTKGRAFLENMPLIKKFFRRPYKLPLMGWLVKPYLIRGRPTTTIRNPDGTISYKQGDFSMPGPTITLFADGFDTFQDDLYLVPNWSDITGDLSIRLLQQDAILKADRALADNYREREDTLAKASPRYQEVKWGRTSTVPVQQPEYPFPPQTPPGQ